MSKQRGFLLLEASIALVLASLAVILLFYTFGQTNKIEDKIERRVDRAYAWHIFNTTSSDEIIVHDHHYQKSSGKKVIDKTTEKTYEVN